MKQNLNKNISEECSTQIFSTQETSSSINNAATVTTTTTLIPDCGRKMTFDNVDYRQEVHPT